MHGTFNGVQLRKITSLKTKVEASGLKLTCGWRITKWADFGRFLSNAVVGYKNVNKNS
jgi:hypothetical protein